MRVILLLLVVFFVQVLINAKASEVKELTPVAAHMSSQYISASNKQTNFSASKCIDGDTISGLCITKRVTAPWLAIELHGNPYVDFVVIYGRTIGGTADRFSNSEIRVTDQLPLTHEEMYTGGDLLNVFKGPRSGSQIFNISGDVPKKGHYVLIQKNNKGWLKVYLGLHEVKVFGIPSESLQNENSSETEEGPYTGNINQENVRSDSSKFNYFFYKMNRHNSFTSSRGPVGGVS